MVRINISRYEGDPPSPEQPRRIEGGPLYPKAEVVELAKAGRVNLWTASCRKYLQFKLEWDDEDVSRLVSDALPSGRFRCSEWCEQEPRGPWAACDAYDLVRAEYLPNAKREMSIEYYLKFAIAKAGSLLMISLHLPGSK